MSATLAVAVASLAETEAFGRRLGRLLFPGAVLALEGQLGAGKTHLVRALAVGLDIRDERVVSSPTFVLIQEYQARLPIYHFDAYRLRSAAEFDDLGAHEYLEGDGVCLIEWAERVSRSLPGERLTIRIVVTGAESRCLELAATGARYEDLLRQMKVSE